MSLVLELRDAPDLPVDAAVLTPDGLFGLGAAEIAALPVRHGATPATVGDFFSVIGTGSDIVELRGDLGRFERLGAAMDAGRLIVDGPVGAHVAAGMTGGECEVRGDAGPWAGAELHDGRLTVHGSAGDHLGAAYPGARAGMTGGEILVHGDAGEEAGAGLRRGLIAVAGRAGDGAALRMLAGTVIALGGVGRHPGIGVRRGSIVAGGPLTPPPGYSFACRLRPPALRLALAHLRRLSWPAAPIALDPVCERWSGDRLELGRGEILILENRE